MAVKQWTIKMKVGTLKKPDGRRASSADEMFTTEELTRSFALASAELVGTPGAEYVLSVTQIKENERNDYTAMIKVDDNKGITEAVMSHVLSKLEDILSRSRAKFSIVSSGPASSGTRGEGVRLMNLV